MPRAELEARAAELERRSARELPLYGIPFAIKDNIDLAGHPTTAACPQFAHVARESAPVVERLLAAGAILVGKTNLDQFATGLVGVRSPYGVPANTFDPAYIPGGSSSGSAVAVAAGLVSFSLGTDTAGSGRVPAAFNNLVGLKPTRGLLSARGVVPACRSLDCVSIFALTADDAASVLRVASGFDPADPFSRPPGQRARALPRSFAGLRFGVPREEELEFFGNPETPRLFRAMVEHLERLGGEAVRIEFEPFLETARLLYDGPWVAERYVAIREFIEAPSRGAAPGHEGHHRQRQPLFGERRVHRVLPAQGTAAPHRRGVGLGRHPRHADGRNDLPHRRGRSRAGEAQQQSRLLHQFHEPAGSRGDRGARRVPARRPSVRRHFCRAIV